LKKIKIKEPFDIINGADPLLASPIQANGLISRTMGDSLAIAPPLIIKASQVNDMLGLIKQSLDETLKILVGPRLKKKLTKRVFLQTYLGILGLLKNRKSHI